MKIAGTTAIVTGGNRGIGEAFVRCLLEAGAARVYVGSRRLEGAAHLVEAYPDRAVPVELDVTDEDQVVAAAAACGDTSIVINNAGVHLDQTLLGAPDMTAAREEMDVNYFGTLSMCRRFAPVLASNGGGAIVNVLSAAAIVPVPNMGGYSPSKFATRALTTNVRAELAEQGTQVSCLIVGSVDTRMASHVEGRKEPPETVARAGLKAIEHNIPEVDTDAFAIGVRAALARDPGRMERQMAALLKAGTLSTGR
ncbi:MAG: SDR family oxidoreductase [Lysobacterales bacterium]|jgi:NAD(P)-dependent dehydrogenase (short-subunit alcohol dehydrogenase family)